MTIEIRQMVIKSNIDQGAAKPVGKGAGKTAAANDSCEDCGGSCEGSLGGSEERQKMRAMLSQEFERLRER